MNLFLTFLLDFIFTLPYLLRLGFIFLQIVFQLSFINLPSQFQQYIINQMTKTRLSSYFWVVLVFYVLICLNSGQVATCHYTCSSCSSPNYYNCLTCPLNRGLGNGGTFAGMCYCSDQTDQNQLGQCTASSEYNYNNKSVIVVFIALSLSISFLMMVIRGFRYYFLKIVEDVQELSLIVFINLYFPQQFDIFLTYLYRFNISSYTFQAMARGSLFSIEGNQGVISNDGSNIIGKFKLLYKTSNFFSNQFTWMIVFASILAFMFILRCLKNSLISEELRVQKIGEKNINLNQISMSNLKNNQSLIINENVSQANLNDESPQKLQIIKQKFEVKKQKRQNPYQFSFSNLVINLHNIMWFNFIITFFYLSLVQININVFTQMSNLTFSSSFAATGAFFSAVFLALEVIVLVLLFFKCKQELIKPQWMHDYSFSAIHYLIRTNYKSLTKYFFFFCSIKKICFALIVVVFYDSPASAILGLSLVQSLFLCLSIYCQPFQKRHLRLHFYLCEVMKLFFFISLVNFVQKYKEFAKLIEITKVLFLMLAFIFGFHFVTMMLNLIIEWSVYWYQIKKIWRRINKWCDDQDQNKIEKSLGEQNDSQDSKQLVGYFHYIIENSNDSTQSNTPNINQNLDKQVFGNKVLNSQKFNAQEQKQEKDEQEKLKKYFYVYKDYTENRKDTKEEEERQIQNQVRKRKRRDMEERRKRKRRW